MLLENRTAIVSGIGPGMGRDIALALAREGANLVLAARTAPALDELAAEIRGLGRRAIGVATDIARSDDSRRLVEAAIAEFGRIDKTVARPERLIAQVDEVAAALEANEPAVPRVLAKVKALADAVRGARVAETV